jgi:FKBP-type peptidyl-prolyl cis-trans isomerase SlyD
LAIGEAKDVVVAPAEGYGDVDPEEFVLVPHDAFPDDMGLSEGVQLSLRDPDIDETVEGIVTEIRDDGVLVNLNHPLAGETLYFNVEIVSLREATASEMSHGHVHHPGHDH